MAIIAGIKARFIGTIDSARVLYNACLASAGLYREPAIESAFLQMFKGWEMFLEDVSICLMCGRLRCGGTSVQCYVRAPNEAVARGLLYQEKRYIEWTDPEIVRQRLERYFPTPSVILDVIMACKSDLVKMKTVRNAIAHSSPKSVEDLSRLARNELGGNPVIARPAELLTMPDPKDPAATIFDRFATVLESAGTAITG